ncbi:unnamed protein product [Phytophthora fragariaefolia]|uniref:Unnamed protein product n=1 Tax=Phytophthora fragariaefolia TaxID=1490495 RepID=A0A9W6X0L3_9STRA|nr:unnamed protein product [Phytophthora fragariaefolia]
MKAASYGHLDILKWLCMGGVREYADMAVEKAASRGQLQVVRWLVPYCTEPRVLISAMELALEREANEVPLVSLPGISALVREQVSSTFCEIYASVKYRDKVDVINIWACCVEYPANSVDLIIIGFIDSDLGCGEWKPGPGPSISY